jgi:hypothetical protein
MKSLSTVLTILLFANSAFAQVVSVDLGEEIKKQRQVPQELPASINQTTNVQVQAGAQAQNLPTTYVEASPLVESRAEQLRKQREAAEMNTEMMIVEQLEKDRIDAERRRAQKLFGDKLQDDTEHQQPQVVIAPTPTPAPQVHVVESPAVANEVIQEDIHELKSLVQELKTTPVVEETSAYDNGKFTLSVSAGISEYDASNIKSVYALGFSAGMELNDGFIVEAGYISSSYDITSVNNFSLIEMNQNNIFGALKYRILDGRISPIVGGIASYNYRKYNDKFFGAYVGEVTSQAIDLGLYAGAMVDVSQNFSVGLDLTYMFNLSNRTDAQQVYDPYGGFGGYVGGKLVEETNYYLMGVNATLKF